jgi:hypothetical protein
MFLQLNLFEKEDYIRVSEEKLFGEYLMFCSTVPKLAIKVNFEGLILTWHCVFCDYFGSSSKLHNIENDNEFSNPLNVK